MKKGFIYRLQSPKNDFDYVGSTVKWDNRMRVHRFYLRQYFPDITDLKIEILKTVEFEDKKILRTAEKEFIQKINPKNNKYFRH